MIRALATPGWFLHKCFAGVMGFPCFYVIKLRGGYHVFLLNKSPKAPSATEYGVGSLLFALEGGTFSAGGLLTPYERTNLPLPGTSNFLCA